MAEIQLRFLQPLHVVFGKRIVWFLVRMLKLSLQVRVIIANDTRLRNDLIRLCEERERYRRERDTSVAKHTTIEDQVRMLTDNITALRALVCGAVSYNRIKIRVGEL